MRVRAVATLVVVCVVGFGGFGVLSADAANPAGFSAVVNSLDQLPAGGVLEGVSCSSASQCAVVGSDLGDRPLVLSGDPSSWGVGQLRQITLGSAFGTDDILGSDLSDVACTSSTACVAVGDDANGQPLVLIGDPATWGAAQAREVTLGSAFGDGFGLFSISCTSATACVAVGTDGNFQPLVLAGNPATWGAAQAREIMAGVAGGTLWSVACTSVSSCVAVGDDVNQTPFVLSGDPSTWTSAQLHRLSLGPTFGSGGGLNAVACASASSCLAVGWDMNSQPLVLSGDPSSWTAAQAYEVTLGGGFGSRGILGAVTCASASSCIATGSDGARQPLILEGDPSTTWSAAQAHEISLGAAFGSGGYLDAISCVSSSACTATGSDANTMPLVLSGDPASWGATQAENFTLKGMGFGVSALPSAMACASATSCLDFGSYGGFLKDRTYFLQGNPTAWDQATQTVMSGIGEFSLLDSAACPAASFCVVVGQDGDSEEPFVLAGNPSTFATASEHVLSLGSAFGSGGELKSVTCRSTTSCVAVGIDGKQRPIVVTGNPATWRTASVKQIALTSKFGSQGRLDSVACSSATSCVAVGIDGHTEPLVFTGNPALWKPSSARQITLTSALGSKGELFSVACSSATYCVAVGASVKSTLKPLVVTGNPAHWTATQAYTVKVAAATASTVAGFGGSGGVTGEVWSVSCDKHSYCVAVGGDKRFAPVYIAGSPKQWKGHPLVRPAKNGASFATGQLTTTACVSTKCFAAGRANGGDFVASFAGG